MPHDRVAVGVKELTLVVFGLSLDVLVSDTQQAAA
jgi:hypothetical protein